MSATTKRKPKYRLCWECNAQLWGNAFAELVVDGHVRIVHKACAKQIQEEGRA